MVLIEMQSNNKKTYSNSTGETFETQMYEYRLPIFYKRRDTLKAKLEEIEENFKVLKEKLEEVEKVIIEDELQQKQNTINKKCNEPGGCNVMGGHRKNKTRKQQRKHKK